MSRVELKWSGLNELREALRQLPKHLTEEAGEILEGAVERAAFSIRQGYPLGATGNLRNGVTATTDRGALGVTALVRSRSPHAHLWEFGSQARRTKKGAGRGSMPAPPSPHFVPIVERERMRATKELIELVRREGFEVSGGGL